VEIRTYSLTVKRKWPDVRIINGTARGADRLCATLAVGYDFKVVDMPADWNTWGKAAGFKRNVAMLEHLDAAGKGLVLAFWDGVSKGTQHTIREARKRGLDVHVCLPGGWVVDGSNPEG
jgi:hypothetical protein